MRLRDESGQILIIGALTQIVFMVLVGFAVDYGFMLVEQQKLQNAVDAASLAGARALVDGSAPGIAVARTTTLDYLDRQGYRTDPDTTVAVTFPVGPSGAVESVAVDVQRHRDTFFIRLVGLNDYSVAGRATAAVDRKMIDIMLSLDLTGSMELSGTNDLQQLRRAVVDFVNMINPSPSNPLGPKIGMARFAGVICRWKRANGSDTLIDVGPGPSEYQLPCDDDKSVLSNLTLNKATLLKLADNSGGGSCPAGQSQYACPLVSWTFSQVQDAVTGQWLTPAGLRYNGSQYMNAPAPHYTGTKLPNGITVTSNAGYYAWSTANGGRNNAAGEGTARKVLVMITDGQNELAPSTGNPAGPTSAWDTEVVNRANTLKLGPDGIPNTIDDVEIYTIGFFCTPYNAGSNWCKSKLAEAPHSCPGPALPANATNVDHILRDVSSSAPGACDRYFPIGKSEDLPALFRTLAGAITRGRLTQ